MSTIKLLTHIVFATKHREMTINEQNCIILYRYITSFMKENHCYLKQVNGMADHIHILVDIHPSISVATLVQKLKHNSSIWITQKRLFANWHGWCEGYFACAVSPRHQDAVSEYIRNQKYHHLGVHFGDEYQALLRNAGIEFSGYLPD